MADADNRARNRSRQPRNDLEIEEIRRLLAYNPETGVLTWLPRPGLTAGERRFNGRDAGNPAGRLSSEGYLVFSIHDKSYRAHRIAWAHYYGSWPAAEIDHINGVRDDNRIENLRAADRTQNAWNRRVPSNNTSGHRGVKYVKRTGKWHATIGHLREYIHLGSFETAEEARDAYLKAAAILFAEFSRTE